VIGFYEDEKGNKTEIEVHRDLFQGSAAGADTTAVGHYTFEISCYETTESPTHSSIEFEVIRRLFGPYFAIEDGSATVLGEIVKGVYPEDNDLDITRHTHILTATNEISSIFCSLTEIMAAGESVDCTSPSDLAGAGYPIRLDGGSKDNFVNVLDSIESLIAEPDSSPYEVVTINNLNQIPLDLSDGKSPDFEPDPNSTTTPVPYPTLYVYDGDLEISASQAMHYNAGLATIYVRGNVYINGDIIRDDNTVIEDIDEYPNLGIISTGNIYIRPDTSKSVETPQVIDASLFAQGMIETAYRQTTQTPIPEYYTNQPLIFHGTVASKGDESVPGVKDPITNQVYAFKLNRTNVSVTLGQDCNNTQVSECFAPDNSIFIATPPGFEDRLSSE